jgi:hypothetical protein
MLASPHPSAPARDDFKSRDVGEIEAYLAKKHYSFRPARAAADNGLGNGHGARFDTISAGSRDWRRLPMC